MMLRLGVACLLGCALLVMPGCGKSVGKVTGKVTLKDGKPAPQGTTVTFWAKDNRFYPSFVGADGVYIALDVATGEMKVTVVPPPDSPAPAKPKDKGDKPPPANAGIPLKYKDQNNTPLKTTISRGENKYDITLE
jgi:hypothetical protein